MREVVAVSRFDAEIYIEKWKKVKRIFEKKSMISKIMFTTKRNRIVKGKIFYKKLQKIFQKSSHKIHIKKFYKIVYIFYTKINTISQKIIYKNCQLSLFLKNHKKITPLSWDYFCIFFFGREIIFSQFFRISIAFSAASCSHFFLEVPFPSPKSVSPIFTAII